MKSISIKIAYPTLFIIILLLIPKISFTQEILHISFDNYFIWRDTQVIEATGLENTFLFTSNIYINHSNMINNNLELAFDLELILRQNYSYKARYKKFFDIYGLQIGIGRIIIRNEFIEVSIGNNYSPDNDLANEQIIPPIARTVPDFSTYTLIDEDKIYYNILSSKPRDIPIIYDSAPFNLYDTGISAKFSIENFSLYLYILNGEEGLDSNSNKYYASAIEYKIKSFLANLFFGIGNIGSVPFKSYANKLKLNIIISLETLVINSMFTIFNMGFTHNKLNVFDHSMIDEFGFDGLPFEPYDIPNLYNAGKPLIGYGFYIQIDYTFDIFSLKINLSLMDADYRYSKEEIYQIKWRIYGFLGMQIIDDIFLLKLGSSYTYNPVFLLGDQLYHFWESIHIAPVDNRLNYYSFFIILQYKFDIKLN